MLRKLVILALLTFALGIAAAGPAPAAVPCGCEVCWDYSYCYDGSRTWNCAVYLDRFCMWW